MSKLSDGEVLVVLVLVLLWHAACGKNCEGWSVPPKVAFERMAAARLKACVQGNPCYFLHQCFERSNAYCLDAGYDKTCGQMEPEGTCGTGVK